MTHRKHVHESEVEPIAIALRERLIGMVPLFDPQTPITYPELEQLMVLYRFENHKVGQPSYPYPQTWGVAAQYLGVMVPNIQSNIGHPEQPENSPEKRMAAPGPLQENQCPHCGAVSPNPNYCTYCGKPMEVPAQ